MKKILLFASAMLISMVSMAASIDFSAQGYENAQVIESVTIEEGLVVTFDKGTNQNAPMYYNSGTAVRVYGGGTMTVTATGNTISKIVLTYGTGDNTNEITTDCGTFATDTWTGSASSVTFTVGGTSKHRRIKVIEVTLGEGGSTPETPETPEEPETPVEPETPDTPEGAITCAEAVAICEQTGSTATAEAYTVRGYITSIKYTWSEQYGTATFWIADTKDGGEVLQAFSCAPLTDADKVFAVGDYVELVGKLKKYNTTNEVERGTYTHVASTGGVGGETPDTPDTPVTGTEIKGLNYATAYYYIEEGKSYWDFDLYGDYDMETDVLTYPDLYIMVDAAKSKTAINGTYNLFYAEYWPNADEVIHTAQYTEDFAGTVTIKNTDNEGNYSFKGSFVAGDGKTYTFNQVVNVIAYEYSYNEDTDEESYEDLILSEDGTSGTPDTPDTPDTPKDMLTCAEAANIAAAENYKGTADVTVYGFVVEILKEKVDDKTGRNKQSFWMSDTKGGEHQFQAYYAFVPKNFFKVGDQVAVTGILQNYNGTIEIADGEAVLLEETTGVEDVVVKKNILKVIKNGQMYIIRDGKAYNVLGAQL